MKISTVVMAHPRRAGFVAELMEQLDVDAEVVWDRKNDRWDTGRRSLLAFDPSASHHFVIQDDSIPCRDLVAGLERAVEHTGDHPLGLYLGLQSQQLSNLAFGVRGTGWISHAGPWWGPGLVIPTDQIPELVRWCDPRDIPNYDRRIARYYQEIGLACWYSVPSLVDHRPDHESLVPGRNGLGRVAARFLGRDKSALDLDWSAPPLRITRDTRLFRHVKTGRTKPAKPGTELHSRLTRETNIWQPIPEPQ